MLVVLGIVLMARRRYEDRVHVDDVGPEPLQIIQVIDDALQVSAVEAVEITGRDRLVPGRMPAGSAR